jgi:hypothetical protein
MYSLGRPNFINDPVPQKLQVYLWTRFLALIVMCSKAKKEEANVEPKAKT